MATLSLPDAEYIGVLPSKAKSDTIDTEHENAILDIVASFIHGIDYSLPPFSWQDPALKAATVKELQSWGIGEAMNGVMKYLDVGLGAAELFYPSHHFELKIIVAISTTIVTWIDSVVDSILDAVSDFQRRFYARLPQLHPVLDHFANYILRLYDHYEAYVAGAMITSICCFMDVTCLEIRALTKRMTAKRESKLWPYYVRSLSGIASFYSFACFPKVDHPDLIHYIQAIPEMLIFTNHVNDVLSFYKEEMDGEQHNYCQMMSRVAELPPINVLEDISRKAVSSAKCAEESLKDSPAALKALMDYELGITQVAFHHPCSTSSSRRIAATFT
ncbi:terpenoid synthase [Peniophora sp. CONT]|nr:terpenoid synthase [Peniophora sp. CONT]